jgi:hypothetical protein
MWEEFYVFPLLADVDYPCEGSEPEPQEVMFSFGYGRLYSDGEVVAHGMTVGLVGPDYQ